LSRKIATKPTHHDSTTSNIRGILYLFDKIRNRSMQIFWTFFLFWFIFQDNPFNFLCWWWQIFAFWLTGSKLICVCQNSHKVICMPWKSFLLPAKWFVSVKIVTNFFATHENHFTGSKTIC
jgi:hypothetical protein